MDIRNIVQARSTPVAGSIVNGTYTRHPEKLGGPSEFHADCSDPVTERGYVWLIQRIGSASFYGAVATNSAPLRHQFPKGKSVTVQILHHHLAKAVGSLAWRLRDHGAAALQVGVKYIEVVNVQVDVPLERLPFPLRKVASPDLKMNPDAAPLHNGVDASRLVLRGLKDAVNWIEGETQNIAVILRSLSHLPNTQDRRGPPHVAAHLGISFCRRAKNEHAYEESDDDLVLV
jgi:hypothetical protein